MTPKEKSEELVEQLGVLNAIYLVDSILIVIEDYNNLEDINDWKQVRNELLTRPQINYDTKRKSKRVS